MANANFKSLEIQGYKSLSSVKLDQLYNINYLVGPNGSGKTSVFECLYILEYLLQNNFNQPTTCPGLTSYAYKKEQEISFSLNLHDNREINFKMHPSIDISNDTLHINHKNEPIGRGEQANMPLYKAVKNGGNRRMGIMDVMNINLSISYIAIFDDTDSKNKYYIHPSQIPFNFDSINNISKSILIDFLNKYYPFNSSSEKVTSVHSSIKSDKAIQFLIQEISSDSKEWAKIGGDEIPLASLSGGLRSILKLYFGIADILREFPKNDDSYRKIICIEEPENGFHPSFQKEIPYILENFVKDYNNVFFIVSTHSPFIISSATKYIDNQKIYLFDKGSLIDLL